MRQPLHVFASVALIFSIGVHGPILPPGKVAPCNLNLHVTLLEPRTVNTNRFAYFLNSNRLSRLKNLEAALPWQFRSCKLTMIKVKRETPDDQALWHSRLRRSPDARFSCLDEVFESVEVFATKDTVATNHSGENMLLAAALTPFFLRYKRMVDVPEDELLLHVIVIFATGYSVDNRSNRFRLAVANTCESLYPTHQDLRILFFDQPVLFLLVTPNPSAQDLWKQDRPADHVYLYPPPAVMAQQNPEYQKSQDTMATFVSDTIREYVRTKNLCFLKPEEASLQLYYRQIRQLHREHTHAMP